MKREETKRWGREGPKEGCFQELLFLLKSPLHLMICGEKILRRRHLLKPSKIDSIARIPFFSTASDQATPGPPRDRGYGVEYQGWGGDLFREC